MPDDAHEMAACTVEKWALFIPAGKEDYPRTCPTFPLQAKKAACALQPLCARFKRSDDAVQTCRLSPAPQDGMGGKQVRCADKHGNATEPPDKLGCFKGIAGKLHP